MLDLKLNPAVDTDEAIRILRWSTSDADLIVHLAITSEAPGRMKGALWLVHGTHPVMGCRPLALPMLNRGITNLTCDLTNVAVAGDRFGPAWLLLEVFTKPAVEDPLVRRIVVTRGPRANVVRFEVEDRRDRLAQVRRALNNVPRPA